MKTSLNGSICLGASKTNTFAEDASLTCHVSVADLLRAAEPTEQVSVCGSDQSRVAGLRVFEADDLQSQRLLHFGHVCLPRCLQQRVTFKLI